MIFLILALPSISKWEVKLMNYLPLANIPSDQVRSLIDGYFEFIAGVPTKLVLYGKGFTNATNVSITTSNTCDAQFSNSLGHMVLGDSDETALIELHTSDMLESGTYHFCLSGEHQGKESEKSLKIFRPQKTSISNIILFVLRCIFLSFFLVISFIYNGEGVIIMDLSISHLQRKAHSGTKHEKKCAKGILQIRKYGKRLLAAFLLGSALSSAGISHLLDVLLWFIDPYFNILISFAVVFLTVTIPTVLFSRYPLVMCYYTIPLAYITLYATLPESLLYGQCLENDIEDNIPERPPEAATEETLTDPMQETVNEPMQATEDDINSTNVELHSPNNPLFTSTSQPVVSGLHNNLFDCNPYTYALYVHNYN